MSTPSPQSQSLLSIAQSSQNGVCHLIKVLWVAGQQDVCPQLKERELQAKPITAYNKGLNEDGEARPVSSLPKSSVLSSPHWLFLPWEALADVVDHILRTQLLSTCAEAWPTW